MVAGRRLGASICAAALAAGLWSGLGASVAQAQSMRISSFDVQGNQRVETGTILTYTGLRSGANVSAGELNDAYQKLVASGLFQSVELVPQGGRLVIRVEERPTINVINFEGNRRLKDADLGKLVQSQSRRVFSPDQAQRDAELIAQAYQQQGRIAAKVTPRIIRRSDNRVDLVFEIFEGGLSEVERISFVGNRAYSDRRLRRVLESKQAGLLRALIKSDTFVADRLEFDKQVLRDFYLSRGYVDFRTVDTNAELARERDGYFVTFNVQEGQQFRFGNVSVVSEMDNVDAAPFEKALKVRSGVVYSPAVVENSIARLERLAIREGLDFVRVDPRITRNDRDLTLDVEFALVQGDRIFVERIDIEGNATTLDRVVRRQFRIVEGDPFNPREIRESAERIRALGYFSDAKVNAREGSTPDQVIIDVDVEEQGTGSFKFGGTYSTDNGFGAAISFQERNFLGRGQQLGFGFTTGVDNSFYNFNFAEPAFLARDVRFDLDLSYRETKQQNSLYDTTAAVIQPAFTFPLAENSRLQLRYTAAMSDITGTNTKIGTIIKGEADEGRLWDSSVGYTYSYDTRRTGLNPNAGVLLQFSQDFGGLGGDTSFVKTTAKAVAQTKVMSEEVTLRASLEGGALSYGKGKSRVTDRFYLGSRVMRGFEPLGIGPREYNEASGVNDALGGNFFAVARLEAEFPLGLPEEYGIRGGLFYDAGSLWGVGKSHPDVIYDDFEMRQVIGASVFWKTPIGPLRFNFSHPLEKKKHDKVQNFNLSISTEF